MESRERFYSILVVCALVAVIALCAVVKGCNDSDNEVLKQVYKDATDKNCITIKQYGVFLPTIVCK